MSRKPSQVRMSPTLPSFRQGHGVATAGVAHAVAVARGGAAAQTGRESLEMPGVGEGAMWRAMVRNRVGLPGADYDQTFSRTAAASRFVSESLAHPV